MKVSAVLAFSIPVVAASQLPAVAADPSASGSWLQSSISELAPAKARMSTTSYATAQSQKHVVHVAHASAPAPTAKLRPFAPGRYLPSERDLRAAAMQSQQAHYDYSAPNAQLNGNVSQQYSMPPQGQMASQYDQYRMQGGYNTPMQMPQINQMAQMAQMAAATPMAQRVKAQVKKAIGQRAPRMMPGQIQMIPAQLAQQAPMAHAVPEPPMQRKASMPVQQPNSMQIQQMQMQQELQQQMQQAPMQARMQPMQQQQQAAPQFQPDDISQQEVAAMFRQVKQNKPQARVNLNGEVVGQALDNPGNGAGQPPLPLAFMGGAGGSNPVMQHLMQGNGNQSGAPKASFGSWHGTGASHGGGFQSYLSRRTSTPFQFSRAPISAAPSAARRKGAVHVATHNPHQHAAAKHNVSAPPAVAARSAKPVVVATYPAYQSFR